MKYSLSEINELIRNRRSIYPKQFSDREVHREQIQVMIENARWAPSHKMTEPWRFVVFMAEAKDQFGKFHAELYKQESGEAFTQMKYDKLRSNADLSSAVIAIVMKRDEKESVPENEELAAVACAVQNMHLTATAFGLGGYWGSGGMTYNPKMRDYLGFGEKDKVLGFFYLGYPKIEWPRKPVRKEVREITDWRTE